MAVVLDKQNISLIGTRQARRDIYIQEAPVRSHRRHVLTCCRYESDDGDRMRESEQIHNAGHSHKRRSYG
jgi:hypothetical protein